MQEKSKESGQMLRQFKKTTFVRINKGRVGGFMLNKIVKGKYPAQDSLVNPGLFTQAK